jgi:hypothetical protein
MRKIEREIITALNARKDRKFSARDKVYWDASRAGMVYQLWETPIALVRDGQLLACLISVNNPWAHSRLTRSRLSALGLSYEKYTAL